MGTTPVSIGREMAPYLAALRTGCTPEKSVGQVLGAASGLAPVPTAQPLDTWTPGEPPRGMRWGMPRKAAQASSLPVSNTPGQPPRRWQWEAGQRLSDLEPSSNDFSRDVLPSILSALCYLSQRLDTIFRPCNCPVFSLLVSLSFALLCGRLHYICLPFFLIFNCAVCKFWELGMSLFHSILFCFVAATFILHLSKLHQ